MNKAALANASGLPRADEQLAYGTAGGTAAMHGAKSSAAQTANRRVLIDGYFLGKPYGFGRFIAELCRALGRSKTDMQFIVAVPDHVDSELLTKYETLEWRRLPAANFIIWEQITLPRLARRLGCDVIHFPYNTRALYTAGIRTVTTVHDVIFLDEAVSVRAPKAYFASKYAKHVFAFGTHRSDSVVAISETTRRELTRLGLSSQIVYNTIDGFLETAAPVRRKQVAQPYILHRGGYQPHRNTQRMIDAFRAVRKQRPELSLKIVGAARGASVWDVKDGEGVEFLPWISDQELADLYANSACVHAASLQEGFGLPIIEGFAFASPVITSDLDPMREVAGGAALLVDPLDVPAMTAAMLRILSDPALAETLIAKGSERSRAFRSERVAQLMVDIYRN